jgi:SAM-dependent methyltransferase
VELVSRSLELDAPICEFGAWQADGREQLADLRALFAGKPYIGADMREGKGVDRILDLHDIDLPDASVAAVISRDTFDQVEYPRRAIDEIHRILKPDGIVVLTSVMNFPIHAYPNDYWRFTPEGFKSLLGIFNHVFVGEFGLEADHPETVVGLGFKGYKPDICPPIAEKCRQS